MFTRILDGAGVLTHSHIERRPHQLCEENLAASSLFGVRQVGGLPLLFCILSQRWVEGDWNLLGIMIFMTIPSQKLFEVLIVLEKCGVCLDPQQIKFST